jgi:hypothetical protein
VKKPTTLSRGLVLIFLLAVILSSCKSEKIVNEAKLKPMSAERILRKIEDQVLDYRNFSIKRISCQVDDGDNRTTFRANLSTQKDKSVVVSFNKLNIPVGKILLTPDKVKYVNYLEKNYFEGDYSFIQKLLNVELDFSDIQAFISNNLLMLNGKPGNETKDYTSDIEFGKYILRSSKERELKSISKSGNRKELRKQSRQGKISVLQTIVVNPQNFSIEKIRMEEKGGIDWLEFVFDEYTSVGGRIYPGSVGMEIHTSGTILSVKLHLAGFDRDKPDVRGFKIPEKYERIKIFPED